MKTKQKEKLKTINLENILAYLKEYALWCDWRKQKRKSRITKIPYKPKIENRAYVDNPNTFSDFASVVSTMKHYDVIGILCRLRSKGWAHDPEYMVCVNYHKKEQGIRITQNQECVY